jgi:hypothetical protein
MYAIEFHAHMKDGTIEIPEAYRERLQGALRVIILAPDVTTGPDMIQQLLDNPLTAPDFRPLSRDELYADRVK